jgi:hypothetical protein
MSDEPTMPVRRLGSPDFAVIQERAGARDFPVVTAPAEATGVVDPLAPPSGEAAPVDALDIRALLHPAEYSRLLIALAASAIVFGGAAMFVYARQGWVVLAVYTGLLIVFGGLVWLALQVFRSRLLGGAVRVSNTSLPELQSVFDEVRMRLNYKKHVDVYVKDKVDGGSIMTSYLGTRLIQIEGGLVAELLGEGRHAELTYLIGRHIGQLKARHQRLEPIFLAISLIDSLKILQLFLAPYLRATAKSGDQIAAACCGDIRATAGTMNRLLVGKELGPRLAVKGVLDQAAIVRRRWLPRLAQLLMSQPHATNRYLNLLAFYTRVAPEQINAWRASLDTETASRLTAALDSSANRRAPRRTPNPVSTLLATLVSCGILALSGWLNFGGTAPAASITHGQNVARPSSTPQTTTGSRAASRQLLTHVPTGLAPSCTAISVPAPDATQGADAEIACHPGTIGSPADVLYVHYRRPGAVRNVYASLAPGLPSGDCTSTPGQGPYSVDSQPAGQLACYVSKTGQNVYLWTDNRLAILVYAESNNMTFADLYQWWLYDAGPQQ